MRRAAKLTEAADWAKSWPADLALVDALLLRGSDHANLGVPSLVLATGATEAASAERHVDKPGGWVAKDAAAGDLVNAVERLLTGRSEPSAGSLALLAIGALLVVLVGLLLYLIWTAVA